MARSHPRDYFLDHNLFYKGTAINPIVKELTDVVKDNLEGRMKGRDNFETAVKIIVLNLFNAYRVDARMPVGIPRDSGYYTDIHNLGFRSFVGSVDALEKAGYISLVTKGVHKNFGSKAFDNDFVKSATTTYKATSKLAKYFEKLNLYSLKVDLDQFHSVRVGKGGEKMIPLKEMKQGKKYLELKETNKIINEYYDSIHIDLCVTDDELTTIRKQMSNREARKKFEELEDDDVLYDLNFRRKYHHRKFWSEKYDKHGRFYGCWWQGIPKEWRKRITINNILTSEMDYTCMHFAMLYHQRKLKMTNQGDLYDLSKAVKGWKNRAYRDEVKLIMNYMLNCKDAKQVEDVIKSKREEFPKVPEGFDTWTDFINFIEDQHSPIADNFYSNKGIELMYLDQLIAEKVILEGIKNDVCIISVHDSFIFKHTHQGKVMNWMNEAYDDVIGKYGKSFTWDILRLKHLDTLAELQDKDIDSYLNRLQEWNWHRQYYGDSSLPLALPQQ